MILWIYIDDTLCFYVLIIRILISSKKFFQQGEWLM